jgi:hypothetical protein
LSLLWRSIPLGTFDQREIWGIFERRVQACAMQTITLRDFFESLKRKLKVQDLQGTKWEREEVAQILERSDAEEVLREIREHPALCVLHVRVQQEMKRAAWEKRKQLEEGYDGY